MSHSPVLEWKKVFWLVWTVGCFQIMRAGSACVGKVCAWALGELELFPVECRQATLRIYAVTRYVLCGNMLQYVVGFYILNLGYILAFPCFARRWEGQFTSSYETRSCLEMRWGSWSPQEHGSTEMVWFEVKPVCCFFTKDQHTTTPSLKVLPECLGLPPLVCLSLKGSAVVSWLPCWR